MKNQIKFIAIIFLLAMHPAAFAARPFVGIAGIEYAATGTACSRKNSYSYGGYSTQNECFENLINGFSKMLETAIVKTNKMAVYEREQINPVLTEQLAGQAGLTNRGGKIGGLDGIDYIVSGSITKLGARQESAGIAGEVLALFGGGKTQGVLGQGVQSGREIWEMAVDIKVVDVSTGQIVAAETMESDILAASGVSIAGVQQGSKEADYLSDVQRDVARKIAALIVTQKFPIRAVSVNNDVIALNYNDSVLEVGECLNVYSLGEDIIDPDTDESLGREETLAGEISVTEVNNKLSKAKTVGDFVPEKGMVARKKQCSNIESSTVEAKPQDNRRKSWNDN